MFHQPVVAPSNGSPRSLRFILAITAGLFASGSALAETISVNFETPAYVVGPVNAQDGWKALGSVGSGCALYDVGVVTNTYGFANFGGQSLRDSNARTSGCFGDQTFSKALANEAGESLANNASPGGAPIMSSGLRQPHFEASWEFASTVPGAEQSGLSVVASADRGDGARMNWLQMTDTPGGLGVNFYDYVDNAPLGSEADPAKGCDVEDDFFFTQVATGLSRTTTHSIRMTLDLVEGPANDVVKIYVDGTLRHTGTSWEDYFRWCEGLGGPYDQGYGSNESRTIDSILFRTGGGAQPATLGKGFLIDNLVITSSARPIRIDVRPNNSQNQVNTNAKQLVPIAILGEPGFDPVVDVDQDSVVVRGASPISTKFDVGDVNGDGLRDLTLYFRARGIRSPTPTECVDPAATLVLDGATLQGAPFTGTDHVAWLGC